MIDQTKILKLQRAIRLLSASNQMLLRATKETQLIRDICELVVKVGGYSFAWVAFSHAAEGEEIVPMAWAGSFGDYLKGARVSWADSIYGEGPTAVAIKTGQTVVYNDRTNDGRFLPWRNSSISRGFVASIAIPLKDDKGAFGAISIYSQHNELFSDDEKMLLEELAGDLAFGILSIRARDRERTLWQALIENKNRLRLILNNVQAGILVIDAETRTISEANTAASKMIKSPLSEDLIGKKCTEVFCSVPGNKCPILDLGQASDNCEHELKTLNGKTVPVQKIATVFWQEGRKFILECFIDISTRKMLERERDEIRSRLQQAQKMEAIGSLAGGIAHDFNNILTSIIGYSELAQLEKNNLDKVHSYVKEVIRAGERARDLVKQILSFSRVTEEEVRPLRIHIIVKEAIRFLKSSLPATIQIIEDIDANCGPIVADPTQIYQVVLNLCTNAYHAMKSTGGELRISLSTKEVAQDRGLLPERYACLEVSDTGPGITPAHQKKVFEPYFTTKKIGEGTGLGLSIVKDIVQRYKGRIELETTLGEGTTFRVYFPEVTPPQINVGSDEALPSQDVTGEERILVVDDDLSVLELIRQFLIDRGYKVTAFDNPLDALEHFRQQPQGFDIVLTDMTMPKVTGAVLAEQLLKLRKDIPIILFTGFNEMIDEKEAKSMGIKAFLHKPFKFSDLAKILQMMKGPSRVTTSMA